MEGRRRLADRFAVAAGERLSHRLDDLPLARDRLEGGGDVFAQLAQPGPAAALTGARRIEHDPLTRQMLGEGRPRIGTPALEARDVGGLGQRRLGGELV